MINQSLVKAIPSNANNYVSENYVPINDTLLFIESHVKINVQREVITRDCNVLLIDAIHRLRFPPTINFSSKSPTK